MSGGDPFEGGDPAPAPSSVEAPAPGDGLAGAASVTTTAAPDAPGPSPAATAGEPPTEVPPDDGRSGLSAIRDNLEAVAFALILALLLRQFCLEVFKIPTKSMEPTLYGENSEAHPGTPGDRIVVDKLGYLARDPGRGDVVVFHHVLDWSRDFIKRIWVLPNECAQIVRGDVWVAAAPPEGQAPEFHPARKPANVRGQLYVPVWPPTAAEERARIADYWRERPNTPGTFRLVSPSEFRFEGVADSPEAREPEATLDYGFVLMDLQNAGQPRAPTGARVVDVRLRMTVRAEAPGEVEIAWKPGDGREHVLRFASEGRAPSALRTKGGEAPLGRALPVGRDVAIALESVDGDARAWVDGEEVKVVKDEIPFADAVRIVAEERSAETSALSIRAKGGAMTLRDVRLDHDLHYLGCYEDEQDVPARGEWWRTGPGEYAMLGDNTRNSSDSRRWTAHGERLKDGTEIWWDSQSSPARTLEESRWWNRVTDVDGIERRWLDDDVDHAPGRLSKRMPFVSRDRIVGRAFFGFVFPLDSSFFERLRFVR